MVPAADREAIDISPVAPPRNISTWVKLCFYFFLLCPL